MKITKIEKKKRLYLLELDDSEKLYVTEDTIVRFMLSKGMEITEQELKEIQTYAQFSYGQAKEAFQHLEIEEDQENQQELLYKELDKQYRKYSKKYEGYDLKQRLTQALARKGYDFSDIASALREYL